MSIKVLLRLLLQLKFPLICFSRRFQMWRLALRHLTTHCIFTTLVKLSRWFDNLFSDVCAHRVLTTFFSTNESRCILLKPCIDLELPLQTLHPLCFRAWRKSCTTLFGMIQYVSDLFKGSVVGLFFYPWLVDVFLSEYLNSRLIYACFIDSHQC